MRNSLIPDLTEAALSGETRVRVYSLLLPRVAVKPFLILRCKQRAQRSARAAVIPRNVRLLFFFGRGESDEYLLQAIRRRWRRRQRPGAVKRLRTALSQWRNETNPSDKQLWKLNLF